MRINGTPDEILAAILRDAPNIMALDVARQAREAILPGKPQLLEWQGATLYALARQYDRVGAHILELGTAAGYSATILADACSRAAITTINPIESEVRFAAPRLAPLGAGITSLCLRSWEYHGMYYGPAFDLVFVDGDHKRVLLDLPWWDWVRPHGLMLFHDYSPIACPPVFAGVNEFAARLGREPDVLIMDDAGIGIAGFYRGDR